MLAVAPVIFKQRKKIRIVKNNLKRIFIFVSGVFGMPARSCEDFINHYVDNITFRAYYPTTVYERNLLG
jgi:hypothetical protein